LTHSVSNALPQALVLTAIVIGFAMVTFLLVLLLRTYAHTGTLDVDEASFLNEAAEKDPVCTDQNQTFLGGPS
jgi:multicomponent Na+:H+ antiporter subunit C